MGVRDAAKGLKTVLNGFGRGAEIRGGVRKPLETVSSSLRRRDTPMNGGVNETARKLIMRIAAKPNRRRSSARDTSEYSDMGRSRSKSCPGRSTATRSTSLGASLAVTKLPSMISASNRPLDPMTRASSSKRAKSRNRRSEPPNTPKRACASGKVQSNSPTGRTTSEFTAGIGMAITITRNVRNGKVGPRRGQQSDRALRAVALFGPLLARAVDPDPRPIVQMTRHDPSGYGSVASTVERKASPGVGFRRS